MKNPKVIIVTALCAAIIGILAFYAAITTTFIPGVAALYPAAGFEVISGIWFGIWGALASYIGLLIAGTGGGWFALPIGLVLSLSDFILALAPAIAFRIFNVDPELKKKRDIIYFLISAILFGSIPSSLYYNFLNLQMGVIPSWEAFWIAVLGWNLGNIIVIPIIGIPLLKSLTPFIKQSGLLIKGLFN